jgi:5'-nucleotidase
VGPDAAYTPETTGDDATQGGVARLATLIDRLRRERAASGPVVLLDGGDVTMGTLFHTVTRETGSELQLMRLLAYDGVTLGNHEFDFRVAGLAQMFAAAQARDGLPPLIATNLDLSSAEPELEPLRALYARGAIERTRLFERDGLKIGLVGILGQGAQSVLDASSPVRVTPPVDAARDAARALRGQGAELVIALSHSGVRLQPDGTWGGEEVDLMTGVPELDVVVGGHSHTALEAPILVGGRPIVQAGCDTQYLGELGLVRDGDAWRVERYTLHALTDELPGRFDVTARVADIKAQVDAQILAPLGLRFDQVVGEVEGHHGRAFEDNVVGNLVTDAMRRATGADVAVTGNGTLRADLFEGTQRVSDLFRVAGLGVGLVEDTAGYALVKGYVSGPDLKSVLEFLLIGYTLKGPDYFPRLSGVRVTYNPWRVPFDRIARVEIGDEATGLREVDLRDTEARISIATTTYIAKFLPQVRALSYGLLDATFLDADGVSVPPLDLTRVLVDTDAAQAGVQELKEWRALVDAVRAMPDTDNDGVPNISTTGAAAEGRLVAQPSLHPAMLFGNATWRMGAASAGVVGALVGVVALVRRLVRRLRRRG